jgi:hypothetical protein
LKVAGTGMDIADDKGGHGAALFTLESQRAR